MFFVQFVYVVSCQHKCKSRYNFTEIRKVSRVSDVELSYQQNLSCVAPLHVLSGWEFLTDFDLVFMNMHIIIPSG
jgi:hypothetical protein